MKGLSGVLGASKFHNLFELFNFLTKKARNFSIFKKYIKMNLHHGPRLWHCHLKTWGFRPGLWFFSKSIRTSIKMPENNPVPTYNITVHFALPDQSIKFIWIVFLRLLGAFDDVLRGNLTWCYKHVDFFLGGRSFYWCQGSGILWVCLILTV